MNTNKPNFELTEIKPKKERVKKAPIEKGLKVFTVQVQTVVAGLPEKLHKYKFKDLAQCVDYVREHYRHWLFAAVDGVCVVDNFRAYRINPNNFSNFINLKKHDSQHNKGE